MPKSRNSHPIPRSPQAAKRLGFTKRTEKRHPLRGLSSDEKRKMVMVSFDTRSGAPKRYCHFDPKTGLWICSDSEQ
ncbi:hypothetical protein ACVIW0_002138 [Bradyrhizobium sp. USDA 4454]